MDAVALSGNTSGMEPNNSSAGGVPERRRRAAVLADPTRARVLELLESASGPLGVAELAEQVGVHHTSVRSHLARLRDAGLARERTAPAAGRGRPRLVYEAVVERDPYRELSALLAEAVRTGRSAREVGRDAGAGVAAAATEAAVSGIASAVDPVDVIEAEAVSLGFAPRRVVRREQVDLVLQHCPFREVAAVDPDTICSLHLGIAEGIAGGLAAADGTAGPGSPLGPVEVLGMVVKNPHRAGCRLQLRPTEVHT